MLARQMQSPVSSQNLDQIKSMFQAVRNAGNPEYLMAKMMSQNPAMRQVTNYVNSNGGTAKAAFLKLAQQNGANPIEVLKMLYG